MTLFDRDSVPEFSKDLRKLKIPSIEQDLTNFEKAFEVDKTKLTGVVQIPGLQGKGVSSSIYKATKFRCKFLQSGSKSGVRVIFAYGKEEDKLIYIEIYKKNQQTNHDESRILKYFKSSDK